METKKTFVGGRMNKDDDERLLQDGEYRHAENTHAINSEGGDVGAIENAYSNKRLTTLTLGSNPKTITPNLCVNKVRNKIYWMVKSDTGCFLLEYNANNNFTSFVLADTRPLNTRVFNLNENYLITGIEILIGETEEDDLMFWTDDNMQPCCINIERAKTYGTNGFVKEDIYLIKKPPATAPRTLQINSTEPSNYLEEKFVLFAYRYQYLDGEYSALSSYSYYNFSPKPFQIDFLTGENLGMVNNFNTVNIFFNTGEKQVKKVEIVAKISNSNALYKIESFDKKLEGWADNEERFISFNNNKIYTILPENEGFRYFDNIPLKAKSLTLIENRPVFGNYVEGQNLIDQFGNKIKPNLIASFNSYEVAEVEIDSEVVNNTFIQPPFSRFNIDFTGESLSEGKRLIFNIRLSNEFYTGVFNNIFEYILLEDYLNINTLSNDPDFINFIEDVWTSVFANGYTVTVPGGFVLNSVQGFTIEGVSGNVLSINAPWLNYTNNVPTSEVVRFRFTASTEAYYSSTSDVRTLKSIRDYEVGIVYKDEFQRATTVLNSENNTVFIPIEHSVTQNKLVVRINHLPPAFANTYKLVVKAQPLNYQIIYVNQFFEDGVFRWVKLEGENKDKVKEGDVLILKSDRLGPAITVVKTKVLEVGAQEADFIVENADIGGTEIVEPAGFYMKIRPNGFSMDYAPDEFFESESNTKVYEGRPISYADLFSFEAVPESDEWTNRALTAGSTITLYFKNYERADGNARFERTYTLQTDYDDFEAWFDDVIVGTNLTAENGEVFDEVAIRRGFATKINFQGISYYNFTEDLVNGKLYLEVKGVYAGNTGNRRSFLDVKVTLRNVTGIFVFETETRNAEQELYYESEETFEIINGAHQGNIQNQDEPTPAHDNILKPAIVELDFFNAYCFGNGVESYQVKDSQLKDFLNIDMKPSIVQVNEYKQIRRFADMCFGGTYNEGFNAVNEFLIQNLKQLDKQYGSIQKLFSRNTNVLVFQEFKTSYVLYAKNTISTATGTDVITRDAQILGEQVPYAGENGVGTKPESVANDDFRFYFANPVRGSVVRLSMDGTEDINIKMVNWFRDMFQNNPFGVTIGGYDPHHRQYAIHFKEGTPPPIMPKMNVPIIFTDVEEATYYMVITDIFDEVYIDYEVETGIIDIGVDFDGAVEVYENLDGSGTITVTTGKIGALTVVITSESPATFTINNRRSESPVLKMKLLTIGDEYVAGKSITNQHAFSGKTFNNNIFFDAIPWVYYAQLEGNEGDGQIPINGRDIELSSYKSNTDNLDFNEEFFIGYLVTEIEYGTTDAEIEEMVGNATFVSLTTTQLTKDTFIKSGIFNFTRANNNQILYLIWDYRRIESESGGESGSVEESEILPE